MNVFDQPLHFNRIMILITSNPSYFNNYTRYTSTTSDRNISKSSSIFKHISKVRIDSFNPRCRRYTASFTCISSYLVFSLLAVLLLLIIQPINANNPLQSTSIVVKEAIMNSSSNTHYSIDRIMSRYESNNNIQKNDNDKINIQTDITGYLLYIICI